MRRRTVLRPALLGRLCCVVLVTFGVTQLLVYALQRHSGALIKSESTVAGIRRARDLKRLVLWARSKGAVLSPKVELREIQSYGFGVVASESIRSGEKVCEIPKRLLVRPDREGSPIFNLAKRMIRRRKSSSYFASLPWDDVGPNDIAPFESLIQEALEGSDEDWDVIEFGRAVFLVLSRIHSVHGRLALVPLCDMFNTDALGKTFNVDCSSPNAEAFTCKTTQSVPAGDQLFVQYRNARAAVASKTELEEQWGIRSD